MNDTGADSGVRRATEPTFFVVGAPKSGTTSLYHYLDQHPEIYVSPIKEPNHFASEIRPEHFSPAIQRSAVRHARALAAYLDGPMTTRMTSAVVRDWHDYLKLFRNVRHETAVGEASVLYLWSATAAARIHDRLPGARILMVLRNPVDRVFSEYLEYVALGWTKVSFRAYISDRSTPPAGLQLGEYAAQVARYYDLFPRDAVAVHLYDDYAHDPTAAMRQIFTFLGVDANHSVDVATRHRETHVPRSPALHRVLSRTSLLAAARRALPRRLRHWLRSRYFADRRSLAMSQEDRTFLVAHYRNDVEQLAQLLGRDLSSWLR